MLVCYETSAAATDCCTCPLWPVPLAALLQVNNVAELLLVRGLAQVVKHRAEEERSGGWCMVVPHLM